MSTVIRDLKNHAHALHNAARAAEPESRLREALAAVSRQLGFKGWSHLTAVLSGTEATDYGTLLVPREVGGHGNIWSADLDEARTLRAETNGYLLAWRHHYLVVDRFYIDSLGLDADDPDWDRIGRDWSTTTDLAARERLYGRLFQHHLAA
jgi:hypothetical protein